MKRRDLIAMVAMATALLVGTGTVQAETYTGCVTPGGSIINMAQGESPAKPCRNKAIPIHLDNRDARQNPDVDYNHAKVCEAFDFLAVPTDIMEAMGCPADPTAGALGTLRPIGSQGFANSDYNICGVLKAEKRDEWGDGYHWVVDGRPGDPQEGIGGGFLAGHEAMDNVSGLDECPAKCEGDPKCIAALFHPGAGTAINQARETTYCDTFHYSDHVTTGWNDFCGVRPGLGVLGCAEILSPLAVSTRWWVRCPD